MKPNVSTTTCKCVWDYCVIAKRIALKTACTICYPIQKEVSK